MKFPTDLKIVKYRAGEKAKFHGLTFPSVIFEMVDMDQIHEAAAFVGMPTNIQHFLYGQDFEHMSKKFQHGMARIFEMVINHDPGYAYLLNSNVMADQKLVIAHVFAHVDFFFNNVYFKNTDRKMVRWLADKAVKIEGMKEQHGEEKVEDFITDIFKLGKLIEPPNMPKKLQRVKPGDPDKKERRRPGRIVPKEGYKGYMDEFLNPSESLEKDQGRIDTEEAEDRLIRLKIRIPERPTQDVLGFLARYAPLEDWQREIIWFFRKWLLYLYPQGQTHVMNEGWAAYWHSLLTNTMGLIDSSELSAFAKRNAGTLGSPGFNPYKIGKVIWENIEYRWDTARHGPIYDNCEITEIIDRWDEFVVFKYLYEMHSGDPEKIKDGWGAVHLLEKCIVEQRVDFPPEAYSKKQFVNFAYYYFEAYKLTRKYETMVVDVKKRVRAAKNNVEKVRADAAEEDATWYLRFHRMIKMARQEIEAGKFTTPFIPIPKSFWEYAKQTEHLPFQIMKGREKMFQVREKYNDIAFFREFMTTELVVKLNFFNYELDDEENVWVVAGRESQKIKNKLERMMANCWSPIIMVKDGNYMNAKELYLVHEWDYIDLDLEKYEENLEVLLKIWQNPVHLEITETAEEKIEDEDPEVSEMRRLGIIPIAYRRTRKKKTGNLALSVKVISCYKDGNKVSYDVEELEEKVVPKIF